MNRVIVIIAALLAFFFIRYLLQLRARRRIPFLGAGTILGGGSPPSHQPRPPIPDSTLDAVERGQYPPASYPTSYTPPPTFDPSIGTYGYPTHPGEISTPAARQAYLAAELRAAQALLDRSTTKLGGGITEREVRATKARISELEARQTSAWALGVDSETK
ncbi:hypothetical protein B0H14DRAFT_2732401 [Mycena olivaceomarginata]|nr:hypothetical protein B0H14DRAFT_2732401 [Mycena olivaceomarginata]